LQNHGLRTYFNDHPFPANLGQALQTTANEIHFRWDGLSHWLGKGLTFWWFDANWAFSIPPPNTVYGGSGDGNDWEGMDNRVWGSHVYYETMRQYNLQNPTRAHTQPAQRPMSLTKYADDNMVRALTTLHCSVLLVVSHSLIEVEIPCDSHNLFCCSSSVFFSICFLRVHIF
jgi:hypothetical protein